MKQHNPARSIPIEKLFIISFLNPISERFMFKILMTMTRIIIPTILCKKFSVKNVSLAFKMKYQYF